MNIDLITSLTLEFDGGDYDALVVTNTDFKDMTITEEAFKKPSIDLLVSVYNSDNYNSIKGSSTLEITVSYDNKATTNTFTVDIVSVKSVGFETVKTLNIQGVFYLEEFTLDTNIVAFKDSTVTEVLDTITSIDITADTFTEVDSFWQMNETDWDFLSKQVIPFTEVTEGAMPLIGLRVDNTLKVLDTSTTRDIDYYISVTGGDNVLEYKEISIDTDFTVESYKLARVSDVVYSKYDTTEYLEVSSDTPLFDLGPIFDNGNCSDNHYLQAVTNRKTYLDAETVRTLFERTLNSIGLLDYINIVAPEEDLTGNYFVTKIVTKITTMVTKEIFYKRFE